MVRNEEIEKMMSEIESFKEVAEIANKLADFMADCHSELKGVKDGDRVELEEMRKCRDLLRKAAIAARCAFYIR